MSNRLRLSLVLGLCGALALGACSRRESESLGTDDGAPAPVPGNDAAIEKVRAAARALAEPGPTVQYVAAEMEGVIKAETKSQALIFYDGYRATLTVPGDQVTQVTFDLIEAKPTVRQLTRELGEPEETRKGMLYRYEARATGSQILILAEPTTMPATEASLVRRIVIEGAPIR